MAKARADYYNQCGLKTVISRKGRTTSHWIYPNYKNVGSVLDGYLPNNLQRMCLEVVRSRGHLKNRCIIENSDKL